MKAYNIIINKTVKVYDNTPTPPPAGYIKKMKAAKKAGDNNKNVKF